MEFEVFKLLGAGGNIAIISLVFIMWRFDRRLVKIELTIEQILRRKNAA